VDAFIRMAECEAAVGRTINAGRGSGVTIGELASAIIAEVNPGATIVCEEERVRPENSEVRVLVCDNSGAAELLGWRPTVSLEDGLSSTIAWMRQHLAGYKPGAYTV
jgi:dTDP-glucose 4,6-dehydratase